MSADNFYDDLNARLASDEWCDDCESTADEVDLAIELGAEEEEREAKLARALHIIRKAARWQGEEGGFIGHELRERGILP